MPVLSLILLLLLPGLLHAEDIPTLKARVGRPVVQELMGGCSLTCSLPWNATDEDKSASKIAALNDSDAMTAWTEAEAGEKLIFKFPANLPRELNGTPFYGIDIANGRLYPERDFKDLGRIKTMRLFHNGKPLYTIELADTRRWQHVEFDDVYLNIGDTLMLEILDLYPGRTTAKTAAITEIVLQGAH